jgi:hypothetical protein
MVPVVHDERHMPDPFLLILGVIAIACVLLYPLRLWQQKHRRYGNEADGGDEVPLAPPDRRNGS